MGSNSGTPLRLTLDPASVKIPAGYGTYKGHTVVVNDGHAAVTVTPAVIRMGTAHGCSQEAPAWLVMGYDGKPFTLAPGAERVISYTVHASAGVNGSAALLVEAAGPKTMAGSTAGAIGMRVTVGNPNSPSAAKCTKPVALPVTHPGSGGPPTALIVILAVVAAIVITGAVVVARRFRNRWTG